MAMTWDDSRLTRPDVAWILWSLAIGYLHRASRASQQGSFLGEKYADIPTAGMAPVPGTGAC
jgi:hypothetical protein